VKKITECRDCSPDERVVQEINTGVYAVDADFLTGALSRITNENAQGEYYLTDIVEQAALAGKKVRAFPVFDSDEWLGVNTYLDLYRVNQVLLRRRIEQLLLSGVNILDPRSVIVGERVVIEPGVTIGPNTQLLGATNLRRGCFLEGNSYLKDTTVEGGAVVKFCVRAERAIIGTNASVGPFAHLRPGSVLKESVKVGNFVETKNAELGANSSAGHLTYLGDCTIGERVNIGAGTITCNYDGFKKHHTIIEDDCFIGSDTCLIAPLSVGHKSTVGAGSVISADVPANSLALTRPPVTVRRDYVRKERRR
jgi:bifunctional UDP-N-acetylglucosamine pyrophosphorylase/glucosamine-1-phosphate N-acetyltransferase